MNQEKIGKFISELRKEKNITQMELADKLNITDKAISKWENGRCMPDISFLEELSKIFNVSVNELLNGERKYKKRKINKDIKILEVNNLYKSFFYTDVLKDISFDISEGEIVGIIGPNGAGKTTIIKSILGLYKIKKGSVKICGNDIFKQKEKALSNVGCIIEKPDLYEHLNAKDNIKIIKLLNNIKDEEYIDKLIKLVKLDAKLDIKVKKYSLGMKQRLALLLALIKRPKLLILDEPTNGLDPNGIKELRSILKVKSQEENLGILISSHILSEVENICDKIIIINDGKILSEFGIEEVKYKNISLEDEYFRLIEGKNYENN